MHPARHARAFTLLELMIVVGMAALVLTISVPFVQRTLHQDATYTAVKVFLEGLQNARSIAILGNQSTDFVVHPADGTVSVEVTPARGFTDAPPGLVEVAAEPGVEGARPKAKLPPPFTGRLSEDVRLVLLEVNFEDKLEAETAARVRFFPNGTSDEFTVVFRVGADQWRKISLDVITGTPTMEVMQ